MELAAFMLCGVLGFTVGCGVGLVVTLKRFEAESLSAYEARLEAESLSAYEAEGVHPPEERGYVYARGILPKVKQLPFFSPKPTKLTS